MTNEIFKKIIVNLKNGDRITDETAYLLSEIALDESEVQRIFLDFIRKIIDTNNYNKEVMKIIQEFLSGNIDLKTASFRIFNAGKTGNSEFDDLSDKSLILPDNLKRGLNDFNYPYKKAQFYHFSSEESIFDKMLRVLFEFTRGDEQYLRGVCFDYCLFLSALDIMKNNELYYLLWS